MNFNYKMMGSLLLPSLLSQTVLFTARAQEIPSYQDTRLSFDSVITNVNSVVR
jgi:hypothetical protein